MSKVIEIIDRSGACHASGSEKVSWAAVGFEQRDQKALPAEELSRKRCGLRMQVIDPSLVKIRTFVHNGIDLPSFLAI